MTESSDIKELERRMSSAIETLKKEFTGLRTGRASVNLLDPVVVEAYGQRLPLKQVGNVSAPEPRMLSVSVWDKGMVLAVQKAIRDSGLGLNPMAEGTLVRIPLPELTQDRRKELVKVAHKYAEQSKIAIRNVRRDGMEAAKKAEKDGKLTQDAHRKLNEDVQKLTDRIIKQVDETLAHKEKDILTV